MCIFELELQNNTNYERFVSFPSSYYLLYICYHCGHKFCFLPEEGLQLARCDVARNFKATTILYDHFSMHAVFCWCQRHPSCHIRTCSGRCLIVWLWSAQVRNPIISGVVVRTANHATESNFKNLLLYEIKSGHLFTIWPSSNSPPVVGYIATIEFDFQFYSTLQCGNIFMSNFENQHHICCPLTGFVPMLGDCVTKLHPGIFLSTTLKKVVL